MEENQTEVYSIIRPREKNKKTRKNSENLFTTKNISFTLIRLNKTSVKDIINTENTNNTDSATVSAIQHSNIYINE